MTIARLNTAVIAAALLCAVPQSACAQTPTTLEAKAEVSLSGVRFSLDDVAIVNGPPAVSKALASVNLGRLPRPGYWAFITRQEIMSEVARHAPELRDGIVWRGPDRIKIRATGVAVPVERLRAYAEARIRNWLQERYDDYSVAAVKSGGTLTVPEGEIRLSGGLAENPQTRRRMSVWVDISVDGTFYQSVPVWFSVEVWQEALVAKSALPVNQPLKETDFVVEYRDTTATRGEVVNRYSQIEQTRMKEHIRAGEVLSGEAIEPMPPVMKGQEVDVYAHSGRVSLQARAVALGDGRFMQDIPVKNVRSSGQFTATVIGQGKVKVE